MHPHTGKDYYVRSLISARVKKHRSFAEKHAMTGILRRLSTSPRIHSLSDIDAVDVWPIDSAEIRSFHEVVLPHTCRLDDVEYSVLRLARPIPEGGYDFFKLNSYSFLRSYKHVMAYNHFHERVRDLLKNMFLNLFPLGYEHVRGILTKIIPARYQGRSELKDIMAYKLYNRTPDGKYELLQDGQDWTGVACTKLNSRDFRLLVTSIFSSVRNEILLGYGI